jgi:hypothetical protein
MKTNDIFLAGILITHIVTILLFSFFLFTTIGESTTGPSQSTPASSSMCEKSANHPETEPNGLWGLEESELEELDKRFMLTSGIPPSLMIRGSEWIKNLWNTWNQEESGEEKEASPVK